MSTEEGKKIIAEFLEWEYKKLWHPPGSPEIGFAWHLPLNKPPIANSYTHEHLYFHTSWDWLKPVIDKLGDKYEKKELIHRGQLFDLSIFATIDLAFRCVVETIIANKNS